MKKPPDNPEFARFTDAMRHIMTVPKTAIRERDEAEKREKQERVEASDSRQDGKQK
jgi:hypothetical protein